MFTLKSGKLPNADVKNIIFFVRPRLELMDIIAKNVQRYVMSFIITLHKVTKLDKIPTSSFRLCVLRIVLDCALFSEDRLHSSRDFHILFVPRRSMLCEQRLKDQGVLGSFINMDEYILDLIPYDGDLLSMEYESAFRVSLSSALHYMQQQKWKHLFLVV